MAEGEIDALRAAELSAEALNTPRRLTSRHRSADPSKAPVSISQ